MTEEEPFLSEWESGRVVGPLPASHGTRASLRVLGSGGGASVRILWWGDSLGEVK